MLVFEGLMEDLRTFSRWPTEMASIPEHILGGKGGAKATSLCCFSHPSGVVIKTSSNKRFSPFSVVTDILPAPRSFGVWILTTLSSSRMSALSRGNFAILSKMASYVVSMKVSSGGIRSHQLPLICLTYLHHNTLPSKQISDSAL